MFAATLEELAGQLATLEPPPPGGASSTSSGSGSTSTEPSELMQRLLAKAPSAQLQAYASGAGRPARLQRLLPEQLDQNLRLLGILSAEMRNLLRQMEGLADAAVAALAAGDSSSGSSSAVDGDEALLMAAVLDGAAKEMQLIVSKRSRRCRGGCQNCCMLLRRGADRPAWLPPAAVQETAAEGIKLTTPSEEVAAAATVVQLEPFLDSTLLAALLEGTGKRRLLVTACGCCFCGKQATDRCTNAALSTLLNCLSLLG